MGACNSSLAVMLVCALTQAHVGGEPSEAAAAESSIAFACRIHCTVRLGIMVLMVLSCNACSQVTHI